MAVGIAKVIHHCQTRKLFFQTSDPRTRGRNRFGDVDEEPKLVPEPAQSRGEDEDGCWHCKGDPPLTKRKQEQI